MKRATKTVEKTEVKEVKKELKDCMTLWLHESANNTKYLTGICADGIIKLVGFFNSNKENPKQPDIQIYMVDEEGKREDKPCCTLWENIDKNEKRYLSGSTNENEKVVGWYRDISENEKRPYINVYYSEK